MGWDAAGAIKHPKSEGRRARGAHARKDLKDPKLSRAERWREKKIGEEKSPPEYHTEVALDSDSEDEADETWIVEIPPLATPPITDIKPQHQLIRDTHRTIRRTLLQLIAERSELNRHYILTVTGTSFPGTSKDKVPYGGTAHIEALASNISSKAFDLYMDLCNNLDSIAEIHVVSSGSGAFLALKIVQFIHFYGTRIHLLSNPAKGFARLWTAFMTEGSLQRNTSKSKSGTMTDRESYPTGVLATLIRSNILIETSLPIPRRISGVQWSAPAFYKHTAVELLGEPPKLLCIQVEKSVDAELLDIPVELVGAFMISTVDDAAAILKGIVDEILLQGANDEEGPNDTPTPSTSRIQ